MKLKTRTHVEPMLRIWKAGVSGHLGVGCLCSLFWRACKCGRARTPLFCDRRSVWLLRLGFIPAGVTNPPLVGDGNKLGACASCSCICARFSLGVFLAVGLSKCRMFAALRVHSISAAARFSSIMPLVFFGEYL